MTKLEKMLASALKDLLGDVDVLGKEFLICKEISESSYGGAARKALAQVLMDTDPEAEVWAIVEKNNRAWDDLYGSVREACQDMIDFLLNHTSFTAILLKDDGEGKAAVHFLTDGVWVDYPDVDFDMFGGPGPEGDANLLEACEHAVNELTVMGGYIVKGGASLEVHKEI